MNLFVKTLALLAFGTLATASTGCYSTWDIAPKTLSSLDGFHAENRPLESADGDTVPFDSATSLHIVSEGNDTPSVTSKFSRIAAEGGIFTGIMRPSNIPFSVNLNQVRSVQARKLSILKTGLAIGIPVGIVAILSATLSLVLASSSTGSDGSAIYAAFRGRK